jgi:hypothetical protein
VRDVETFNLGRPSKRSLRGCLNSPSLIRCETKLIIMDVEQELIDTRYNEENAGILDWEPAPRITPDDTAMNMKYVLRYKP